MNKETPNQPETSLAAAAPGAVAEFDDRGSKEGLVRFVRRTLFAHVCFTTLISLMTTLFGVLALAGGAGTLEIAAALMGLGVYGLIAASMMWISRGKLARRAPDGPTWTRTSLFVAIPGTLLTGAISGILTFVGIAGFHGVVLAIAGPITVLSFAVLFALVRIMVMRDLDELVWEDTEHALEDVFFEPEERRLEEGL